MKVLIIETTPATPHAETALEIAVKERLTGSEVVYAPIFHLTPHLIWKSNINGRNSSGKIDSLDEWLSYLTSVVAPFAKVDVFSLQSRPNYLNEVMKQALFDFEYDSQPFGALVKSNAIELFKTTDTEKILVEHRNICEELAETAILVYELTRVLIQKHQPDLVYFFNGRTIGTYPIYLICQRLGIRSIVHERGSTKDRYSLWEAPSQFLGVFKSEINRFSLARSPDVARMSSAIFYYRQRNGRITNFGIVNQQDHDSAIRIPGSKEQFVAYFTSSNNELHCMPTQDCSNALGSQENAVDTLLRVCKEERIQLVIRMHPNTPISEYQSFEKFAEKEACIVIPPSSPISSYKLGELAYRNFSYGSTITWEFMHAGISCATLAQSYGTGEAGVIELFDAESIRSFIKNALPKVDSSFAIKYADFVNNLGERYDFYRAETLFSGTFEVNL